MGRSRLRLAAILPRLVAIGSLSHDLSRPRDQRVEKHCGNKPLEVSHHPAKFGDYRHCGSGDRMVLVCHVISQELVTKG